MCTLTARCTGLTGAVMRGIGSAGCRQAGASTRGRRATNIMANIWPVLFSHPSALALALPPQLSLYKHSAASRERAPQLHCRFCLPEKDVSRSSACLCLVSRFPSLSCGLCALCGGVRRQASGTVRGGSCGGRQGRCTWAIGAKTSVTVTASTPGRSYPFLPDELNPYGTSHHISIRNP